LRNPVKYQIKDTPGHGKLRDTQAISQLQSMLYPKKGRSNLRGIIFVLDAALMSDSAEALRDAASYLHQVLLILQKRALGKGTSSRKVAAEVSVLVAVNKQDLFTALPPGSVRDRLEAEIERIRKSKGKGILDADVSSGTNSEEEEMLGGDDSYGVFSFKLLEEEVGIKVDVVGGAVKGDNEADAEAGIRKWEEWIGVCL
jgi:signal recognition particle receptor subunit beta